MEGKRRPRVFAPESASRRRAKRIGRHRASLASEKEGSNGREPELVDQRGVEREEIEHVVRGTKERDLQRKNRAAQHRGF